MVPSNNSSLGERDIGVAGSRAFIPSTGWLDQTRIVAELGS